MNRIKTLRKQKKMSQAQLAGLLHVNQISQWELERAYPSFEIAETKSPRPWNRPGAFCIYNLEGQK